MPGTNGERSFANIVEDIVSNFQDIVRSEVRLAKAEVREEAAKAGKAGRMLGAGAVLALYALGFLLLTCVYALELAVDPWLAALIVAVIVGAAGGVMIRGGVKKMQGVHTRPEKTIDTMKENLEWAKRQTR